jgi:dTDP-4-dehydrorhamnose reductase
MLRLMADRDSLNVVADQYGSPTYAGDLANAIMQIVSFLPKATNPVAGIYHYSNKGNISWFDFAVAIKELSGSSCSVAPIPTEAYPTPAKRPAYSVMSKEKITSTFPIELSDWKESLKKCFLLLRK